MVGGGVGLAVEIPSAAVLPSIVIRIDRGDSLGTIADALKDANIIRSTGSFKLYSFLTGAAHRFKPGIYTFTGRERLTQVARALVRGPQPVVIIIPEGLTLKDIDGRLTEVGIIRAGDLIRYNTTATVGQLSHDYSFLIGQKSLEGFLFPDTYRIMPGTPPADVVRLILDTFSAKAYPLLSNRSDWYRILTLASLLEKEVSNPKDQALVADVLQRRLKLGMLLQVDATVIYAKCFGAYVSCADRHLAKADFNIDSPYNTYRYRGLPPGPIGNPGRSAIQAVLQPQKNSYLYYLSDSVTKRIIFSKTFKDHDDNRATYVRR